MRSVYRLAWSGGEFSTCCSSVDDVLYELWVVHNETACIGKETGGINCAALEFKCFWERCMPVSVRKAGLGMK